MSLFSYLNADPSGTSSANSQIAQVLQQAKARATGSKAASTGTSSTTSGAKPAQVQVQVTLEARRLAAAKADAGKSAATLAGEMRKWLDASYAAAGKKNSADLTALSGRALAVIALNSSGQFSRAEIAAAKTELRERDRAALVDQMNSTALTSSTVASYRQSLLASRATMSAEEQKLRAISPNLR